MAISTPASSPAELRAFTAGEVYTKQRNLWSDAFRRLIRNRGAMLGLGIVILFTILGVFAPLFARYPPTAQHVVDGFAPALHAKYWFGADQLGRDEYSRMLYGLRISLEVGVLVQFIVVTIGMTVGGAAALGSIFAVGGVGAIADGPEAIQRGHTQRRGEIPVGSAAGRSFTQLASEGGGHGGRP